MTRYNRIAAIAAFLLMGAAMTLAGEQNMIDELIQNMLAKDAGRIEMYKQSYELAERIGRTTLFVEALRYSAERDATDRLEENKGWIALGIANYARENLPPARLVKELVPLLDDENSNVRSIAKQTLWEIEGHRPHFGEHINYIKTQGDAVPLAFYQHMYERDASQALIAMAQAKGEGGERRRELLWKDHLVETARFRLGYRDPKELTDEVAEARRALVELAEDRAWWVRLYAAYRATEGRTGSVLATDELRRTLRDDSHELVAEIAGRR